MSTTVNDIVEIQQRNALLAVIWFIPDRRLETR